MRRAWYTVKKTGSPKNCLPWRKWRNAYQVLYRILDDCIFFFRIKLLSNLNSSNTESLLNFSDNSEYKYSRTWYLEPFWDHENLFETAVVRASEGYY